MAYNPNFTFADPALQNAVVNEAQVRAAVDAARAQQFTQTLAALRQERQAASDREERRAIREGDIRRLEATEAERRRQFDVNTGLTREDIASREKISGVGRSQGEEKELYNNLLNLIERGDDPPTAAELEARMTGLTEPRRAALRERRTLRFNELNRDFGLIADEARRLNAKLQAQEKDPKTGALLSPEGLLGRSQFRNQLGIDPDTGLLRILARKPREDRGFSEVIPQPSPGFVPRETDFRVPLLPGQGPSAGAEPIAAVQERLNTGSPTGFWRALIGGGSLFHPAAAFEQAARGGRALMGFQLPPPEPILEAVPAEPQFTPPVFAPPRY
jgi:hypothetical protein